MTNFINSESQEFEAQLWSQKWFDYRHMTPLQATRLYMDEYGPVYRRHYATEFDRERAEHVKVMTFDNMLVGLKNGVPKFKHAFNGFWRGRQIADFLCMPYDVYIDLAFGYRMRRWKQGHMPQPTHLYHQYDVEKISARWEEMKAGRLYLAEHPAYIRQNYADLPQQKDYHEYLLSMAMLRTNPGEYLADFINNDRIPYEKVRARVDPAIWEMVESYLQ